MRAFLRTSSLSFVLTLVVLQTFHIAWLLNVNSIAAIQDQSSHFAFFSSSTEDSTPAPAASQHGTNNILDLSNGTTSLVINVGSSVDPIMPKQSDGPCALSIAFEPIVSERIKQHPQLFVVPAAVSNRDGLSVMYMYNKQGVSSSLSQAAGKQAWNSNKRRRDGQKRIVPTVSFRTLLESIPPHIPIHYIRTDMQGHDFAAIQSAGSLLAKRGVKYLETETHPEETLQYRGVVNDLCRDWLPYMTQLGYRLEGARNDANDMYPELANANISLETCQLRLQLHPERPAGNPQRTLTYNALWKFVGTSTETASSTSAAASTNTEPWDYPIFHSKQTNSLVPNFSSEEYAKCDQS